jgi:CO/xanthine dehydrogenase Mo-binding subunit
MAEFKYIGKSIPKVDALEKVTGVARYTSDEGLRFPGMLYARVLYSPHAHAIIRSIDTSKAKQVHGVKAVLTGADVPEYRTGIIVEDRHVLCRERVRFVGDAVAVVAAVSLDATEEAIDLIDVKYEQLPAIFDVEEAMKPDCPVIVHPGLSHYARPVYSYLGEDLSGPNVHTHHKVRRGNVKEAFQKADLIVENRFQNDRMTHSQLEPYNCVCYPESDGTFTMWTSGRVYENLWPTADAFHHPANRLRVKAHYVGGMFGISARPERFGLLVAMCTGKPVKIVYSREECFIDGLNRLPKVIYIKDGVTKDGFILAREMKVIVNTGGYTNLAPMTIRNGSFHASQYRMANYKWDAYGVYTNEPVCGPLRGFGSAEVFWATEQQMDIVARKLGMDPLEYRLNNTPDEGETNVRGEEVHSTGAKEALREVTQWIDWSKPSAPAKEPHIKIAKGIALGSKYTISDTASTAVVKVRASGDIEVYHGTDECGQGCNTIFTQMAAESFQVPMEKIRMFWGDTFVVPYDYGAASSRSTLYVGNAILKACEDAKRQLFELAAPKLGTKAENLDTREGRIFVKDAPSESIPFSALFLAAQEDARGQLKRSICLPEGAEIIGKATFWCHPSEENYATGQGTKLTASYCYGAQSVEVAVDTETGVVKILRFASAFDSGRPMNPKLVEGQIDGGMGMGIGCGLFEGFVFNQNGLLLNPNFHDYKIPTTMDVPSGDKQCSFIIEDSHKEGPFGAKGMGEAAMCPTAPAIANAIFNATGARIYLLPMTPERVLKAIKEANL